MGVRFATKVVSVLVCAWLLGGCAVLGGDEPDQAQRVAWQVAVQQANTRFVGVEVSDPKKDGFTSYTYVSVTLESAPIAQDDVHDLIEAIDGSTEESNRGHEIRAGFAVLDPSTSTGIALIELTDVADESMVFRAGTMLAFPAGGES